MKKDNVSSITEKGYEITLFRYEQAPLGNLKKRKSAVI